MLRSKGKFLVFEGIDGSGKTTQVKLLLNYLKDRKIPFGHYSFPRYEKAWGKMVRRYLEGEFGKVGAVNPYLASVLYAGDRFAAADEIRSDLVAGKIVVCDRYVGSNLAHMAAKIKDQDSKRQFIKWLEDFEYGENKIPREDLVILLSMPANFSQKLMKARKLDIHEREPKYLAEVGRVYEQLARARDNWEKVDSIKNGKLLRPARVFEKVLAVLKRHKILQ